MPNWLWLQGPGEFVDTLLHGTCTMFVNYFRQGRIIYIFPKIYITHNVEVVYRDQKQPGTKLHAETYTRLGTRAPASN
jgi:hypothetical protein